MNNPSDSPAFLQPKRVQRARSIWVKRVIIIIGILGFIALIAAPLLIDSVWARMQVLNNSMQPTLSLGHYILVNKLAVQPNDIQRGDIIVFHFPQNPKEDYIKRVIGTPGDTIVIRDKKVYVNNLEIIEPYIADKPAYNGKWVVPEENFFVLGDNRNQSSDSHSWGYVPINLVVGKVVMVYWPPDQIKFLE